ncbi:MAG TPA: hypothetical protein VMF08_22215 [Candidatus Sulfotelmatobacter sp.]|nr:hypothetical protein [Candidatus Sulfotelmatobacter sp.]
MNDPISSTSGSDLAQQVAALQRQVFLLLVSLVVVTATIVFYFYYQGHIQSQEYAAMRPSALQLIEQYRNNATMIQSFEKQLVEYGTTHPSFRPILIKYGLMPNPNAPMAPGP